MKTIIGCSLILVLSLIVAPVYADDYQEGLDAYNRKDYKTAFEMLKPLAEQGNAMAQSRLGLMYQTGRGTPKDMKKTIEWYRRAADQGNANGQAYVGWLYEKGIGVPKDYTAAVKWYRKAASQRNARAQYKLASMYEKGKGVPQDYQEAKKLYRKAADQGDRIAQMSLKRLSKSFPLNLFSHSSFIFLLIVISALLIIFFRGDKKSGPYGRLFFSSLCTILLLLVALQLFSQDSGWNEEQIEFWETHIEETAKEIESLKTTYSQSSWGGILVYGAVNILERQIYDSGPIGCGIFLVGIALVLIWFAKKNYSLIKEKGDQRGRDIL